MPTDPQIPLMALHSLSQQQPPDVMRTMQDMAQLSDYAELSRERRATADKAQQQQEDERAVSAAAQQFTDPQGTTDWDLVLHKLYSDGRVGPAQAIETKLASQKRQAVLDKNTELEGEQKKWSLARNFVNSIDDSDPEAFQTTWSLVQKNVGRLLGKEYADAMGPVASKEKLEQIKKFGEDATQTFTRQKAGIDAADAALKLDDDKDKTDRERRDYWTKAAATALQAARNDKEYQSILNDLAHAIKGRKPEQDGQPNTLAGEVLGQFDKVWTKDTPDRTNEVAMTANERASKKQQKAYQDKEIAVRQAEGARADRREARLATLGQGATAGVPQGVLGLIADMDPDLSADEAMDLFKEKKDDWLKANPTMDPAKVADKIKKIYGPPMSASDKAMHDSLVASGIITDKTKKAGGPPPPDQNAPKVLTEAQIQAAMKANHWTREQAVAAAKARNYTIGK